MAKPLVERLIDEARSTEMAVVANLDVMQMLLWSAETTLAAANRQQAGSPQRHAAVERLAQHLDGITQAAHRAYEAVPEAERRWGEGKASYSETLDEASESLTELFGRAGGGR